MSVPGLVHTVFASVAIMAGGVVLLIPKGTRWHRTLGHVYVTSMVGVTVTAFSIYRLTGGFGPFHVAAVVGGVTLAFGVAVVLLRRPRGRWIEAHAYWMSGSYLGLMAAFAAESLTRLVMPRVATLLEGNVLWAVFWGSVVIASLAVFGMGMWLMRTRVPRAVAKTPHAMRTERRSLQGTGRDSAGLPA